MRVTARRTALVTGGSGFIGRRLVLRLVALGWDVSCVGRHDPGVARTRFVPVAIFSHDLCQALRGGRFDIVFHLAAYGVSPAERDPSEIFAVNVAGTVEVVRAAADAGAMAVIYAGSCSEYAQPDDPAPIAETCPLATEGLYGPSKAAGGQWGRTVACHLGVGFVHLRLFGVYGPGEAPHRMLPSITDALVRGDRARLSDGLQVRDLLHVDDVVEGLLCAAAHAHRQTHAVYNLCSGRPVRVRDAALAIAEAWGAARDVLDFGAIAMRPGEAMWLVGDGTAFRGATGFTPALSLEQGIARAVAAQKLSYRLECGS